MNFLTLLLNRRFLSILPAVIFVVSVLFVPAQTFGAEASTKTVKPVGKPVLLVVDVADASQKTQPTIAGLAPQNTTVDIYINDTFVGNAGVSKNNKVIGDFAFRLPKPLAYGTYKVTAVTRHVDKNKKTTYSAVSKPFTLRIPTAGVKDVRPPEERGVALAVEPQAEWPNVQPAAGAAEATPQGEKMTSATIEAPEQPKNEENTQTLAENEQNQALVNAEAPENSSNEKVVRDLPLTTLQIIGWAALLTAAGLFVYQVRRHRQDIDMALEEPRETEEQDSAKNTEEKPQ